jgi:hypothetical protein
MKLCSITIRRWVSAGSLLTALLLTSCMGQPNDVLLVTSDAVSVFTTKQESLAPSAGNRLAILEPDARVAVLDCLDEGGHSICKVGLSDGRVGFVNDGDYTLSNSKYSDSVWCGAKPRNPQWQQGWVTDCFGPEFSKFAVNGATGPGSRPVFRINHQLVVAVPTRYSPNAGSLGHEPRTCTKLSDLLTAPFLYFVIQGNWSAGYKPGDIPIVNGERQFQPDIITVRIQREIINPLSIEEQNKVKETLRKFHAKENEGTHEVGGLTCSIPNYAGSSPYCSGSGSNPELRLSVSSYSATPFVLVHADYPSSRHGRIQVYWQGWISDVSHALDIDAAIWKSIEEWSLLNPT